MKTFSPKKSEIKIGWQIIDAKNKVLGRVSTEIAQLIMGKNKTTFVSNMVSGDHVVVVNADKIVTTGRKDLQKNYYQYSGFPGGLKVTALGKMKSENPKKVIEKAVSGMLPHNRLHKKMMKMLHVYVGEQHPYQDKLK